MASVSDTRLEARNVNRDYVVFFFLFRCGPDILAPKRGLRGKKFGREGFFWGLIEEGVCKMLHSGLTSQG
jgi:hypothetical protein